MAERQTIGGGHPRVGSTEYENNQRKIIALERAADSLDRIANALERLAAQHGVPSDWDGRS